MYTLDNLLHNIPSDLKEELFTTLATGHAVKIERIVSAGHVTPSDKWYDQAWTEWVILLEGEAHLEFESENETLVLKPNDHILIPSHQRHRVRWTSPNQKTIWLAVHFQEALPSNEGSD